MFSQNDGDTAIIELKIPVRAEYVSIARLTAAGVANRAGFDIEAIEDIKVALSEVCNRIINIFNRFSGEYRSECLIRFILEEDGLTIEFCVDQAEKLGYYMARCASPHGEDAPDSDETWACAGNDDEIYMKKYEDQIQLTFINALMDEFVINPNASCLVSMKKFTE